MRVQLVHHSPDRVSVKGTLLREIAQALREVQARAPLGDRYLPPAGERLDHHEQVCRPVPDVFVVSALDGSWLQWQRRTGLAVQDHRFLIKADGRVGGIVGLLIERITPASMRRKRRILPR